MRYSDDMFSDGFISTIGVDFRTKRVEIDNSSVKLIVWDTAGQERFRSITKRYFRGNDAIIITYDITERSSFESVQYWMEQIDENASNTSIRYLVANKSDLKERAVVSTEEGKSLAAQYGIKFIETSAKESENINYLFNDITKELIGKTKKISNKDDKINDLTIIKRKKIEQKQLNCC